MGKGLLFFCCSCCILLLTIVNLSIGPIISGSAEIVGTENCAYLSDYYDAEKEDHPNMSDEEKKYGYEWNIDRCKNEKGMHDMEYTSFIFDIVIGFVCSLIGLLHLFDLKKDFVVNTGLIGLICGVVGFVLTLVYVILNGIVYTSYYDTEDPNPILKTDGEGALAKMVSSGKYECMYFDTKGNDHSYYAKYSDLIKKQYNYNKDLIKEYGGDDLEKVNCQFNPITSFPRCDENGNYESPRKYMDANGNLQDCKYLYSGYTTDEITNKDKSDRFLTTLILSLFVCIANIGLALFGFLLFRNPSDF